MAYFPFLSLSSDLGGSASHRTRPEDVARQSLVIQFEDSGP